jgi:DNA mismatch endonuclease (patch repair protein)
MMADVFSKEKRSQVMAAIRSKGNRDTELKWRRNQKLIGKPDFVFRRMRLALFVDGCFWHGCPKHGRKPDSNSHYWLTKLERNKVRDKKVSHELRKTGWRVLRLWEHELAKEVSAVKKIKSSLRKFPRLVELRGR